MLYYSNLRKNDCNGLFDLPRDPSLREASHWDRLDGLL